MRGGGFRERAVPVYPLVAGAAIGAAFALRFSEIVFLVPLAALALIRPTPVKQRVLQLLAVGAGFAISVLLFVGWWDLATWGRPFSSLIEFARFTLIERDSSSMVKAQPWFWYLWRLPKWLPLTVIPILFALKRYRWLTAPALFVVLPLAALSLIHHKELRYLQGIIPFVAIAVAGAASIWWERGRRRSVVMLLALSVGFGASYPSFLRKKSMAAVEAARWMAGIPGLRVVALSQPWAYGSTLFLPGGAHVVDVGPSPKPADLDAILSQCDVVALYRDQVAHTPALLDTLHRRGFTRLRDFEWGRSRQVVVFARRSPPPAGLEHPDDGLVAVPMGVGEVAPQVRVDVEDADRPAAGIAHGHHDLGAAALVAGDVAGE